jgi:hypothetical protein
VKSNSSHDLVRSASRHLENLECEFSRLKFLFGELQAQSSAEDGSDLVNDAERSAFNFDFQPSTDKRRPTLPDPVLLEILARNRRKRIECFGEGLFADPAWDMIVDLAIARARFSRVSVTSLCIASGVPSTTALRWIGVLIERGVFQREDDATDRRRAFVSLRA